MSLKIKKKKLRKKIRKSRSNEVEFGSMAKEQMHLTYTLPKQLLQVCNLNEANPNRIKRLGY